MTVVEHFAADSLRHPETEQPAGGSPLLGDGRISRSIVGGVREHDILKSKLKPKAKSTKVRYETKAARKVERTRQKARMAEKAERAGGKRKKGTRR